MSVAVQPYLPDLYDALFAFYARCMPGRDIDLYRRVWQWKYFENPFEPDDTDRIWVVKSGHEIVAHLGTMAARVMLDGEVVRGRWSSDLTVDERYHNGGLGVWLIREWMRSCEVTLAKGLSPAVSRVYERLGWHKVSLRPVMQLPLTLRALTGRVTRSRPVNTAAAWASRWAARAWTAVRRSRVEGVEYRTVESFPEETDELMNRVAERTGMAILRPRRFLQWRYVDCPVQRHVIETASCNGRLRGYAVFSVRPERGFRRGIIHDLEMEPGADDELRDFIAHCASRMHDHRADEIAFLPRTEAEQRAAASLGFVSRRRPDMMMLDVRPAGLNLGELSVDCNVQLGDGDDW